MRISTRLLPKDLKRYEADFILEMKGFFPDLLFTISDCPEPGAYKSFNLRHLGRDLGTLNVSLLGEVFNPQTEEFLMKAASSLLGKIALKKALTLDRESGLYTSEYFMAKLKRLMVAKAHPKSLALDEGGQLPLVLALGELSPEWGPSRRKLIRDLRALPGVKCLGRLAESRIGVLFRSTPEEARKALETARVRELTRNLNAHYHLAMAVYPEDMGTLDHLAREPIPHRLLLEKAATALFFAQRQGPRSPVIAFGDLVLSCGMITQVLPQDRVILNLGRSMGAAAGQIYLAKDNLGNVKGEIAIFETAESYSLAHILAGNRGRSLASGDLLEFSRVDDALEHRSVCAIKDKGSWEKLLDSLINLAQPDKPLLFALARLDDHEKLLALEGQYEAELKLQNFSAALNQKFNPTLLSPFDAGTMAFVWAPPPEDMASKLTDFLTQMAQGASISMGLVFWPSDVISPKTIHTAAKDTLLESAMTGSSVVTVFGPQTLNIIGDRLFDEGDIRGAIEEYRKGLQLDPGHLNILNSLGVCYGRLGDQKAAMTAFEDVLRLEPDNLMATFNKGCSYLLSGEPEEAEKALEKAATLAPDNFEILYQLGKTALELGHTEKALTYLERAAEQKGRRGVVFSYLGKGRLDTGDKAGAMAAFKQAVKFNPDDAQSLSHLGVLYRDEGKDNSMALSLFRRSVELDPSNSLFRRRLGLLLYGMGQFQDAERHLKSALEYSKHNYLNSELSSMDQLAAKLKAIVDDFKDEEKPAPEDLLGARL
ncbi:MAG: tetratricopeptide repeat protein [Deltaproteobacteria bacterium]|jgi:tetratricopeptide (TPR) repeat protein|nr:tetratricopeptide repeat protein [Deltaproteobacteria bacterium]